jgi:hypothetical protein
MDGDYVINICQGKGNPGYTFDHYELSTEDMDGYSYYRYKCVYCNK